MSFGSNINLCGWLVTHGMKLEKGEELLLWMGLDAKKTQMMGPIE